MNLPEDLLQLGTAQIPGVPTPVMVFARVLAAGTSRAHQNPFGRHVYAVGNDREARRESGDRTGRVTAAVYW